MQTTRTAFRPRGHFFQIRPPFFLVRSAQFQPRTEVMKPFQTVDQMAWLPYPRHFLQNMQAKLPENQYRFNDSEDRFIVLPSQSVKHRARRAAVHHAPKKTRVFLCPTGCRANAGKGWRCGLWSDVSRGQMHFRPVPTIVTFKCLGGNPNEIMFRNDLYFLIRLNNHVD